jgi:hypothetical protein
LEGVVPHRFISYLKVSIDQQGKSGLGLETQCAGSPRAIGQAATAA